MRSRIILTFNRNGNLGERAGFAYKIIDVFGNENIVSWTGFNSSTKNMFGQVGISGMSVAPPPGYGQATRHYSSLQEDMPSNFMLSGADNIVQIEVEFDANGTRYEFIASSTNHNHVSIEVLNNIPDNDELLATTLSVVDADCDNATIRVQSNEPIDRYTLVGHDPVHLIEPSTDFEIYVVRGVQYQIEFKSGLLYNTNNAFVPKLSELNFLVKKINDTQCQIVINQQNALYIALEYSFNGGETYSQNNIGNIDEEGGYDIAIRDAFGCLIGAGGSFGIQNQNVILSRSPHYLNLKDYVSHPGEMTGVKYLYLYFWYGDYIDDKPTLPNVRLRAENIDGNYLVDISPYIYDFLEPKLNETWTSIYPLTADTTQISADTIDFTADRTWSAKYLNEGYDEACWVYYEVEYTFWNDDIDSVDYHIYKSYPAGGIHVGTRGYGYFDDGYNPKIQGFIEEPQDKYSTTFIPLYRIGLNYTATHTDNLIERRVLNDNKLICHNNTQKYVEIVYLNKSGAWSSFIFSRARQRKVKTDTHKFNYTHKSPEYDRFLATTRGKMKSVIESWSITTTIQDEANNRYMEELIESEQHYMIDRSLPYHEQKPRPIYLTSNEFEEKTALNNKARIEWTIEFELANNKINRV